MRDNSTFLTYLINGLDIDGADSNLLDADIEELLFEMDIESFSPKKQTINNIVNFARSYDTVESENAGVIELNLN